MKGWKARNRQPDRETQAEEYAVWLQAKNKYCRRIKWSKAFSDHTAAHMALRTACEEVSKWRDPRSQTVTPYQPPAPQGQGSSVIPQTPAGVDPKVWRKAQSERATTDAITRPTPFAWLGVARYASKR